MKKFKLLLSANLILFLSAAFLFALDMPQVRNTYVTGVQALANGQLLQAESCFKTIIAIPPAAPYEDEIKRYQAKSYYFLGDVYFMKRSYEQAENYYKIVLQKYPDSEIYPNALYKLGRTYILNGQNDEGMGLLKSYLANYDTDPSLSDNVLYWLARGYAQMNDYQMAISTFELVLIKYPNTALAYEIRSSIARLKEMLADQQRAAAATVTAATNTLQILTRQSNQIEQEKVLLDRISELLQIKQRLLEIKADKIELLLQLRRQREGSAQ